MFKYRLLQMMILGSAIGCSSDEGSVTPPPNKTPNVTFTFSRLAVARSTDVNLTVDISDPDGDPVSVSWAVTRGILNPAQQGSATMRWSTAASVGRDTLTITASDGYGGQKTIRPVVDVGTPWTGDIPTTQTWTMAGSPYLVSTVGVADRITVFGQLNINAGVTVYINTAGMSINVEGGLGVTGTSGSPVVIRPNLRTTPPLGHWQGILGVGDATMDLDFALITYAESAVRAIENADILLTGCRIMFSTESAVFHESRGDLLVEDCSITNNAKSGVHAKLLTTLPNSVVIRGDSIAVNGRFEDTTEYTDGEAGITLEFNDPTNTVAIDISNNEISRNDFPGIRLMGTCFPRITGNGIFGNELRKPTGKINVELASPFGNGAINTTNNWWGQAFPQASDSLIIKQGIHDQDDDPGQILTRLSVTPWKTVWP